jgi:NitT/TauT family transport system permease protein
MPSHKVAAAAELSEVVKSSAAGFAGSKWGRGLAWVVSLGLLIGVWAGAARFFPSIILPSPGETLAGLKWLMGRENFYHHLWLTALRGSAGFVLAMTIGNVLGLLMGRYRLVAWLLNPLVAISTTVPPIFWVAIMIVWIGLGSGPPVLVIIVTATPLVAVNVAQGVHSISPGLTEMAGIFRVSAWTRLRELYLPAMSGHLFAAALIAVRFAWRTVVMAEFVGSSSGLGNRLAWARQNLEMDLAFAYMLIIVSFGMLLEYGVLRPAQRRWGWQPDDPRAAPARDGLARSSSKSSEEIQPVWTRPFNLRT